VVEQTLIDMLSGYQGQDPAEVQAVARILAITKATEDPWQRGLPLHVTASALVVHRPTARVLLRWHERQQDWLLTGGHADPGETDPVEIAIREAHEETGLADLFPWPEPAVVHVAIVPVPANAVEPAHEHADVRFLLATGNPDSVQAESPDAPLRWLSVTDAMSTTGQPNVREMLSRARWLLGWPAP
jgi:8-oxo-dGTP pyrophosphatase MutT (NUDIX family)